VGADVDDHDVPESVVTSTTDPPLSDLPTSMHDEDEGHETALSLFDDGREALVHGDVDRLPSSGTRATPFPTMAQNVAVAQDTPSTPGPVESARTTDHELPPSVV
jgi:hypothetical protein